MLCSIYSPDCRISISRFNSILFSASFLWCNMICSICFPASVINNPRWNSNSMWDLTHLFFYWLFLYLVWQSFKPSLWGSKISLICFPASGIYNPRFNYPLQYFLPHFNHPQLKCNNIFDNNDNEYDWFVDHENYGQNYLRQRFSRGALPTQDW